jgi:exodeoxyribonuclease V gamma subunit
MLRLFYSNRTEELLRELASRVRVEQRATPLAPVRVIVPNACVEAYVKLGIARERGVAANLDVMQLMRFASTLAPPGKRVADAESLEAFVLSLLLDEAFLAKPELAPVRAYLFAAGTSEDGADLRRVQLASRLGRIFEEYTYSRAELLAAWQGGTTLDGAPAETERWQRAMVLAIFGDDGLASRADPPVVPLAGAAASLSQTLASAPARPTHVFGFAHVARSFYGLFEQLARASDVFFYSLSPCEGFWEDIDQRDPAPLHLWGRPGRDHVRVLNALTGFDHEDRFVEAKQKASTVLQRLQSDVLHRTSPKPEGDPPAADESILIAEHASVRRELEAVASSIWAAMEKDESLRFDEVAVLLPPGEAARYASHLPTVFREAHELPFQMMGIATPAPSPIAEAVDLLLALPLGRFSRGELLRLLVHPSVAAGFPEADPARWSQLCEALGIVHGADRSDHEGTYIERDILNWDQGLRRLALGAFMTGDAGDRGAAGGSLFFLGGEAYAPLEITSSQIAEAASFGLLARSLIEDAKFARSERRTLPEWASFLVTMVSTYVTPVGADEPEELTRVLRRLQGLAEEDLAGKKVSFRVAYELATRRLGAGPAGGGSSGVVVSTIAALRTVPFRLVFACGMGEGRFPSAEGEDPLDLRWARLREGDVTSRDRDKYAFLELLLGVRDRLVLSYVSRDALTGDPLAPSSVVQELLHTLGQGYVREPASLRRRHPLRRWDDSHDMALPEARAEARTLAARRAMDRSGQLPDVHEVRSRSEADEPGWRALAEHLCLPRMPPARAATEAKIVVPMHALVRFLEFPLHGWAGFRFGLSELEEDDVLARESEPFETELRQETLFLRGVVLDARRRGVSIERAYDDAVRAKELRGAGPSGAFARGERRDHVETLNTWRAEMSGAEVDVGSLAVHRFGRGAEGGDSDEVHESLGFEVGVLEHGTTRVLRVEIVGKTLPLGGDGKVSVTLAKRMKESDGDWAQAGRQRTVLRSFLDHAVLCASGAERERSALVVIATPEGPSIERIRLGPLSQGKALLWLRGLVQELLGGAHDYFFPYEPVFVHRAKGEGALVPYIEEAQEKLRESRTSLALRSAYGPVPRPHEYRLPDEAQALAMAAGRFGPLFEGWDNKSKNEAP